MTAAAAGFPDAVALAALNSAPVSELEPDPAGEVPPMNAPRLDSEAMDTPGY